MTNLSTPIPNPSRASWLVPQDEHKRSGLAEALAPVHLTVSVIIPALNEAENLPHVLPRIPERVHKVLLVDRHSTDNTVEVARALWPNIRIIHQEGRGKGAAIRSGFAGATGDIVVMLDADGSTDPAEIPAFIGMLCAGADFVKGSRFLQGGGTVDMPLIRQMGNRGLVVLANLLSRTRYTDITYGYNAIWRRHARALALEIDGWANEIVSNIRVARSGLRVVEVACFEHRRIAGEAKLGALSAGWAILKAMLREPFRAVERRAPQAHEIVDLPDVELERAVGEQP
jgi:glycosyltransferase involved in cell wall biosynthesis